MSEPARSEPSNLKDTARERLWGSRHRTLVVVALTFLPWLSTVIFTASIWTALHLLGYAILVFAVGYSIVSLTLPAPLRTDTITLAPSLGILSVSAIGALTLRVGLSIKWLPILWVILAVPGVLNLWADRTLLRKATIPYGWTLAVLSALICLVFTLPSARNDAVLRHDGSFNWIYEDTQHFSSLASSIARDERPPRTPGTDTAELLYHFGPYVPSATISRITGLDMRDALVRVTRGASVWALMLSCFGLATLLSLKATGESFGGIATVAGLFFYGSLSALFTDRREGSSNVTSAILFNIDGLGVPNDGGPFSHLILGSSLLPALGAITGIMGLSLVRSDMETRPNWGTLPLLALPAFAASVNSLGGLYCLGIVIILLFWGRLLAARSWLLISGTILLFLLAWSVMGYFHAPDTGGAMIRPNLSPQWLIIWVWFLIGLGFRIWGFRWLSRGLQDPIAVLFLATFLCFLSFKVVLHLRDNNEKYGLYFLQCMFSIFAFSRLTREWWRPIERNKLILDWLRFAKWGTLCLAVGGILIGVVRRVTHRHTEIHSFALKVLLCFLTVIVIAGILKLTKQRPAIQPTLSAVFTGVLLIGFLGWVPDWLNYGQGRMKLDVTLTPGEVRGLFRLRDLGRQSDRFATNKHVNETSFNRAERSYGYTALSERPVLLEGYLARGETFLPAFSQLLHDNELMFTTTEPETLHTLTEEYQVRWLVARPGTDIALSGSLPSWLVKQQDCGDLKIYQVLPSSHRDNELAIDGK